MLLLKLYIKNLRKSIHLNFFLSKI